MNRNHPRGRTHRKSGHEKLRKLCYLCCVNEQGAAISEFFVSDFRWVRREDDFRFIDNRSRDGHALLFTSGKLPRPVRQAVGEPSIS